MLHIWLRISKRLALFCRSAIIYGTNYTREVSHEKAVIDYEPHIALFASNHGLEIYEKIFMDLDDVLNEDGIALFEISPPLKDRLTSLIEKYLPLYTYEFIKDINGFTRFLFLNK